MSISAARVLVVDDDRQLVDFIATILEEVGYDVQTAFNGQDGLNLAKASPPSLILMDLKMPIMDGWTCCRLLKGSQDTTSIPVIVMSADAEKAVVQADLKIECFLQKPFAIEDLLSSIKAQISPT